ncbi:YcxB family protein [Paenibacillus sp. ALJ109b]|uniref:YcxB family protein n=1 Tax=Paenibacillus sp. ALJ109b TaxID=2709068 RepID=UPI0013D251C4|nr:YcxB family protein [Paenibacillus sp. ALJ109b]NEU60354.1 YcxB family protein [Paenibacillus sp. ALJ109b]
MELKFNLELKDLADMQEDVVRKSKEHKKIKLIMTIIFSFLIFFTVLRASFSLISLAIIILFVITFPFAYIKLTIFSLKRNLKKQNLSMILGNNVMILSDEGISRSTGKNTSFLKWDDISIVREDTEHYFLYMTDIQGIIIPKRAISCEQLSQEFQHYYDTFLLPKLQA